MEQVMTPSQVDLILSHALQSPDNGSLRDSGYCEDGMSAIDLPKPVVNASPPVTTPLAAGTPVHRSRHEAINIDDALANEAFKSFKAQQKEQFEKVAAFECNQRKALSAHHQSSLDGRVAQHNRNKDERKEQVGLSRDTALCKLTQTPQHVADLEHLEELQISAEHDLRKAQIQETQNVATALKYMEAYCLGTNVNHPEHAHTVTEEDFRKLDRQRQVQQNLPRKHESAINVLRAKQERETKRRFQKHEAELNVMDGDHKDEMAKRTVEFKKEQDKLETLIEVRRRRLLQRWDLKFEMWRRDWEEQHGTTLKTKLEHESWPLQRMETVTPIPESSSLARFVTKVTA
ncbi:hypothetical protein N0V83_002807 [Neocucurbitaria cava]|uniref:Uncharacterized protein n=1 Tax=Neocucurbitaria cava TaxID=798079 RepID=A0A9W8YDD7_9PLEO|nr:hypothetical protein N0V83_002807 [Neocucurbitaria cava]